MVILMSHAGRSFRLCLRMPSRVITGCMIQNPAQVQKAVELVRSVMASGPGGGPAPMQQPGGGGGGAGASGS